MQMFFSLGIKTMLNALFACNILHLDFGTNVNEEKGQRSGI